MKKITFYTLLCTTIILPGMLLAAEEPQTPTGEWAKKYALSEIPSTPQRSARREELFYNYNSGPLTPNTRPRAGRLDTAAQAALDG